MLLLLLLLLLLLWLLLLLLLWLLLPDDDVRLARRIQRDVQHRGRDVASVIHQYTRFVKPSFDQYVAPSRR
jgi:uridine kinase